MYDLNDAEPQRGGLIDPCYAKVSGAAESHRRALSEPDVILSHHPAPLIQPQHQSGSRASEQTTWAGAARCGQATVVPGACAGRAS